MDKLTKKIYFKYNEHPGDLFRDTGVYELPHPIEQEHDFQVVFHPCYMSSDFIAYLDDLYKLRNDEFEVMEDKERFRDKNGLYSEQDIKEEIYRVENEINYVCFENFYNLVRDGQIKIIKKDEKE